jgi:dTDP-4-amino-4,6-dideoxygalactose transaminase
MARLAPSWERGVLTNGPLVAELEATVAERLGVRHVVAVSSCTAGLMLALRALVPPGGRVVLPSFTFSATGHAVAWCGLEPVYAECEPESFQLDPADAARRLDGAAALVATHVFGAPCDVAALTALAAQAGVPLVFDAAHALGAEHRGRPVGSFGDAEVFSLSPTKTVVAGEGGLVATDREDVAEAVRIGRDYGNPGDYDTRFVGLNARMSELHAAVALESLADLDANLARRRAAAEAYRGLLAEVPGVQPQAVAPHDASTWKDFTVRISRRLLGSSRDDVAAALAAAGIDTRRYFDPPVHRQRSHARWSAPLPVTEQVASEVLSLPIYPGLSRGAVERVAAVIAGCQRR